MADKNQKALDTYTDSELCRVRTKLSGAEGLLSRVGCALGFGGRVSEVIERLEAWCRDRERERRKDG